MRHNGVSITIAVIAGAIVLAGCGTTTISKTPAAPASTTAGCTQVNSALDSVFDGSYAGLPPAHTTGDLLSNFLGQTNPVTSALVPIMAETGTASGLRTAEARLNADVNRLDNTSYISSAQSAVIVPDLRAISGICGTSAAWTKVTLTVSTVTPDGSAGESPTTAPAPAASPSSSAPFQAQTLLSDSGSGSYTTERFTIGGSGDYKVVWTYNDYGNFSGQSVNFQMWADGGGDSAFTDPNQLADSGSGVVNVYNDAGTHTITVNSEGNWTIKVVTAP